MTIEKTKNVGKRRNYFGVKRLIAGYVFETIICVLFMRIHSNSLFLFCGKRADRINVYFAVGA